MNIMSKSPDIFMDEAVEVSRISNIFIIHSDDIIRFGIAAILDDQGFNLHLCREVSDLRKINTHYKNLKQNFIICDAQIYKNYNEVFSSFLDHNIALITSDECIEINNLKDISKIFNLSVHAQEIKKYYSQHSYTTRIDNMTDVFDVMHKIKNLSPRQFQILELMSKGLLNKQIAWELGLTEGTIKSHVSSILERMKCNRRTQAIADFLQFYHPRRMIKL